MSAGSCSRSPPPSLGPKKLWVRRTIKAAHPKGKARLTAGSADSRGSACRRRGRPAGLRRCEATPDPTSAWAATGCRRSPAARDRSRQEQGRASDATCRSPSPRTVVATASGGAAGRHIGVADAAFDQVLGGKRLPPPLLLGAPAPPQLLAQRLAYRLHPPDMAKTKPDHGDDGGEHEELGEGKAEHRLV